MNGIGRVCGVFTMALVLSVLAVGCDESGVGGYCSKLSYCYDSYDYEACVETMEVQEQSALNVSEACHTAFLDYLSCVAGLNCVQLQEWDTDGSHCGGAFSTYQNTCTGMPY
ncbi:MAG: hypothetical protein ABI333_15170 [bacterium]